MTNSGVSSPIGRAARPRNRFRLAGPSAPFDPRCTPYRDDLADVALAEALFAPHYAAAFPLACVAQATPVCAKPGGEQVSELLGGERFMALDASAGWTWGYCAHDDYVGYIESDALGADAPLTPLASAPDMVAAAERFLGMPYVLGGRGGTGIDCSGLVQRACAAIGIAAPRDSDMQREGLGTALAPSAGLHRNDLVFLPGHVGIMIDQATMIHATAAHGAVVIEALADVIARVETQHEVAILARKRL
ncbi:MAG: C40 family peptidase [Sphingomonadaceae bacterium]